MHDTLDRIARDPRTLDLAVRLALEGRPPEDRLILLVDQFEEAFTVCRDDKARSAYFANLVEAGTAPGGRTIVVLAMRADFYPELASHRELAQLVAAHQFAVGPLQDQGLRQAIVEPARSVGVAFEAGLADRDRC